MNELDSVKGLKKMTLESLNAPKRLNAELQTLQERRSAIVDSLNNFTPKLNGMPKNKDVESRLERLIAIKLDLESQIADLQVELAAARANLAADIYSADLHNNEMSVLLRRYVDFMSFSAIASDLHFSENRVYCLRRQAFKKLGITSFK